MPLPRVGGTQKSNATIVVDEQDVLDGVTFLFSAVVFLLLIRVYWSLDGPFGTIMIKRG